MITLWKVYFAIHSWFRIPSDRFFGISYYTTDTLIDFYASAIYLASWVVPDDHTCFIVNGQYFFSCFPWPTCLIVTSVFLYNLQSTQSHLFNVDFKVTSANNKCSLRILILFQLDVQVQWFRWKTHPCTTFYFFLCSISTY